MVGDVVAIIPQPDLDGIPQDPVTVTKRRPGDLPPTPPSRAYQFNATGVSDYYENQTLEPVYTPDAFIEYRIRPAVCTALIWDVIRWHVPEPSVHTDWAVNCSTAVYMGINSCIWHTGPLTRKGCNHPRNIPIRPGDWASGGTTTQCTLGQYWYFQYLWVFTNISAYGGGPGPGRFIRCP